MKKFALLILIFGISTNIPLSLDKIEKSIIGIFLFSIPYFVNILKRAPVLIKVYVNWFGVFLIFQSFYLFTYFNKDFVTKAPNLNINLNILENTYKGISGIQKISTDSRGFRTTTKINYKKKDNNKIRIFTVGASTTEQILIDQRKTWTHLLQEKLNQNSKSNSFEIINTALSGTRIKHQVSVFKEILNYKPDVVIFMTGINDWNHHFLKVYYEENKSFFENSEYKLPFFFKELSFDKTLDKFFKELFKEKSYDKDKIISKTLFVPGSIKKNKKVKFFPKEIDVEYRKRLDELTKICKKNKITCVFLDQPTVYNKEISKELYDLLWMTPPNQDFTMDIESLIYLSNLYNENLKLIIESNNLIFCSIDKYMIPNVDYFYDDCHFNIDGSRRVANLVFNCLKNHNKSI